MELSRAKVASQARGLMAVNFAEAMEMAKDDEKVAAFFAKLNAIKTQIDEGLGMATTAKEIDRLLIQARSNRQIAEEELVAAKSEAGKIKLKAVAKAKQELAGAGRAAAEMADALIERKVALDAREEAVEMAQKAMTARGKAADGKLEQASAMTERAEQMRTKAEATVAAMRQAMSD